MPYHRRHYHRYGQYHRRWHGSSWWSDSSENEGSTGRTSVPYRTDWFYLGGTKHLVATNIRRQSLQLQIMWQGEFVSYSASGYVIATMQCKRENDQVTLVSVPTDGAHNRPPEFDDPLGRLASCFYADIFMFPWRLPESRSSSRYQSPEQTFLPDVNFENGQKIRVRTSSEIERGSTDGGTLRPQKSSLNSDNPLANVLTFLEHTTARILLHSPECSIQSVMNLCTCNMPWRNSPEDELMSVVGPHGCRNKHFIVSDEDVQGTFRATVATLCGLFLKWFDKYRSRITGRGRDISHTYYSLSSPTMSGSEAPSRSSRLRSSQEGTRSDADSDTKLSDIRSEESEETAHLIRQHSHRSTDSSNGPNRLSDSEPDGYHSETQKSNNSHGSNDKPLGTDADQTQQSEPNGILASVQESKPDVTENESTDVLVESSKIETENNTEEEASAIKKSCAEKVNSMASEVEPQDPKSFRDGWWWERSSADEAEVDDEIEVKEAKGDTVISFPRNFSTKPRSKSELSKGKDSNGIQPRSGEVVSENVHRGRQESVGSPTATTDSAATVVSEQSLQKERSNDNESSNSRLSWGWLFKSRSRRRSRSNSETKAGSTPRTRSASRSRSGSRSRSNPRTRSESRSGSAHTFTSRGRSRSRRRVRFLSNDSPSLIPRTDSRGSWASSAAYYSEPSMESEAAPLRQRVTEEVALLVAKELVTVVLVIIILILAILAIVFDPADEQNWFKQVEQGMTVLLSLGIPMIVAMRSRLTDNLRVILPSTERPVRSLDDLRNMNKGMDEDTFIKELQKAILLRPDISGLFSLRNASYKRTRKEGHLVMPEPARYDEVFKQVWVFGEGIALNKITGDRFKYEERDNVLLIHRTPLERPKKDIVMIHTRRKTNNYFIGGNQESESSPTV